MVSLSTLSSPVQTPVRLLMISYIAGSRLLLLCKNTLLPTTHDATQRRHGDRNSILWSRVVAHFAAFFVAAFVFVAFSMPLDLKAVKRQSTTEAQPSMASLLARGPGDMPRRLQGKRRVEKLNPTQKDNSLDLRLGIGAQVEAPDSGAVLRSGQSSSGGLDRLKRPDPWLSLGAPASKPPESLQQHGSLDLDLMLGNQAKPLDKVGGARSKQPTTGRASGLWHDWLGLASSSPTSPAALSASSSALQRASPANSPIKMPAKLRAELPAAASASPVTLQWVSSPPPKSLSPLPQWLLRKLVPSYKTGPGEIRYDDVRDRAFPKLDASFLVKPKEIRFDGEAMVMPKANSQMNHVNTVYWKTYLQYEAAKAIKAYVSVDVLRILLFSHTTNFDSCRNSDVDHQHMLRHNGNRK